MVGHLELGVGNAGRLSIEMQAVAHAVLIMRDIMRETCMTDLAGINKGVKCKQVKNVVTDVSLAS